MHPLMGIFWNLNDHELATEVPIGTSDVTQDRQGESLKKTEFYYNRHIGTINICYTSFGTVLAILRWFEPAGLELSQGNVKMMSRMFTNISIR